MAHVAVEKDGKEWIFSGSPRRIDKLYDGKRADLWVCHRVLDSCIELPKGSIKKLIGRTLTWDDEPVELKEV